MRAFAVRAAAALARCLAQTVVSLGQEILVAPDHDQGVYSPGEPIHWTTTGLDLPRLSVSYGTK